MFDKIHFWLIILSMKNLCEICPRNCKIDRNIQKGFCGEKSLIRVAKTMLHFFEEPMISGTQNGFQNARGSGAIFFSGCPLKCVYCQNFNISHDGIGKTISTQDLANIFKTLEEKGAININLVTPTHYTTQIIEALKIYKPKIPIVWNTSGYEKPETIKKLAGFVDIFLTDLKYVSSELSMKYSGAKDYFEFASKSILEMKKIAPNDVIENGIMRSGLIVRHLALPGQTEDSLKVIDWIKENLGTNTIVSMMSQYVPMGNVKKYTKKYLEINRKLTKLEYKILVNKLENIGFKNALIQDLESADESFTPNFLADSN